MTKKRMCPECKKGELIRLNLMEGCFKCGFSRKYEGDLND